jgi:hypothetical protein
MGEADKLGYDDELPQQHDPFLTPEARAFTGAGLVVASLLGGGLFQALSFVVTDGDEPEGWQLFLTFYGPRGVLAAAGAILGWPVHRAATSRAIRGLAAAAVIVGTVITMSVIAGLIIKTTVDTSGPTF